MSQYIAFLVMACAMMTSVVRGQAIARIDENDSLIIKQKLNVVVISTDFQDEENGNFKLHYSENIDDLIEAQNGVSLTRRGNYASEAVNRGMASERMTTCIDGMKIFSACTDKMDPVTSYVATNNLESMELESGGEGHCFGSNTGGLLNMNTKEPILNDSKRIRGNISMGANSVSEGIQGSFNANYSEKTWALRLNGMATKNENYLAGGGKEIQYSQYSKSNFGAALKMKLSAKDYLLIDFIRDDARDVGYPALPMDVSKATADIYSITYRRYLTGKWGGKINAKLYGNNIVHIMDDSERDVVMRMDMPGLSDTYGAYFQGEMDEINGHNLTMVVEGYQNRSYAEMTMYPENEESMFMLTWPDVYRSIIGTYISDKYSLKNNDFIAVTGRIDLGQSEVRDEFGRKQLEVFDYDLSEPIKHEVYSTSMEYGKQIDDKRIISLEIAYSERLPSVSEQFAYYIFNSQDGYDYIGDPYIKDEQAYKAELGYVEKHRNVTWSSSVFAYHMPNYIFGEVSTALSAMTIGAAGVKQYINLDYARISGFEVELSWKAWHWLIVETGFAYNYGIDNDNRPLPLMAPLKNTTSLLVKNGHNQIGLKILSATEQNKVSLDAGEDISPAYAVMDFYYQRMIALGEKQLIASAGVDNIFDTYYHDHIDWLDIPRPGRNFFLKFRFQF